MEEIRNLYEVWRCCQQVIKQRMNEINSLPPDRLVYLYEPANQYIREETYRLANELGIIGIADVQLHGIYKKSRSKGQVFDISQRSITCPHDI